LELAHGTGHGQTDVGVEVDFALAKENKIEQNYIQEIINGIVAKLPK
jgi:hypothetical protein